MLGDLLATARDLGRLREITAILVRYGFADLVRHLGLANALEKIGETLHWTEAEDIAHMETPRRVRAALEELGPTFVKLGQLLSTRVDLFPPPWIEEFERLQDEVSPVDFERLRGQVEADLGAAPESVFATFDTRPMAAGSIAQVHAATLPDGSRVVVKIRRPGIEAVVDADLRLLARLASIAHDQVPEAARYRLPSLVEQFRRSIRRELDLAGECRNAERMAANQAARHPDGEPPIVVPRAYWDWTGERINVQQRIEGIPGRHVERLAEAGLDGHRIAREVARAMLADILEDGFFHADPHPGNLFFLPGHRIAFIDFGMVGMLSERRREQFVNLLHAIVEYREEEVADVLLEFSNRAGGDDDTLIADVGAFLRSYHGVAIESLNLADVVRDLLLLLRSNELVLPPELAQTFKVFITLDGLVRRLDPEFNLVEESAPIVKRAFASFYSPVALAQRGRRSLIDAVRLLARLPRELRDTLHAMARGSLQVRIDVSELDRLTERIDRAASRVTVGLITAALIIGTAIVMTVDSGPRVLGLPLLGAIGFVAAGIGGTWVLISILRGN